VHTGNDTSRKTSRRVSLGGVPLSDSPQLERQVSLSRETFAQGEKKRVSIPGMAAHEFKQAALIAEGAQPTTLSGEELERKFEKQQSSVAMSPEVETVLKAPPHVDAPDPARTHAMHNICTHG
jgi:hypothetical protein